MAFFSKKNEVAVLEFPKSISIENKDYIIDISFSKKKSSSVITKENIIIFRLSSYLNNKQKEEHFNSLLKRVVKKISSTEINSKFKHFKEVIEKGYFYFAGDFYKFEINMLSSRIKIQDNIIYYNPKIDPIFIEKKIISHFYEKYLPRIEKYVNELNKSTYNYPLGKISLKLVNSKWGHCTVKNDILLNLKLLNANLEILNYVIFHEIAHVRHKDHSLRFWNEVRRFCPNYLALRKKLKAESPGLYYFEQN